jgi:predicted nucleotidyltransferase component of viral defense system
MRGFVLVGGTALTMHLGHRVSEDLDFMWADTRLTVLGAAGCPPT